jgi:hypothetical protein
MPSFLFWYSRLHEELASRVGLGPFAEHGGDRRSADEPAHGRRGALSFRYRGWIRPSIRSRPTWSGRGRPRHRGGPRRRAAGSAVDVPRGPGAYHPTTKLLGRTEGRWWWSSGGVRELLDRHRSMESRPVRASGPGFCREGPLDVAPLSGGPRPRGGCRDQDFVRSWIGRAASAL